MTSLNHKQCTRLCFRLLFTSSSCSCASYQTSPLLAWLDSTIHGRRHGAKPVSWIAMHASRRGSEKRGMKSVCFCLKCMNHILNFHSILKKLVLVGFNHSKLDKKNVLLESQAKNTIYCFICSKFLLYVSVRMRLRRPMEMLQAM